MKWVNNNPICHIISSKLGRKRFKAVNHVPTGIEHCTKNEVFY